MNVTAFIRTKKDTAFIRFRLTEGRSLCVYATSKIIVRGEWWDSRRECIQARVALSPATHTDINESVAKTKERITTS